MRINRVYAENFRAYKSLEVEFKEKFTILCGPNGSGKSSILFAIAHGLYLSGDESGLTEDCAIQLTLLGRDGRPHHCGFKKGSFEFLNYHSTQKRYPGQKIESRIGGETYAIEELCSPLFIGPNRIVTYENITGMKKEPVTAISRNIYINTGLKKLSDTYVPEIKQWMVNRFFMSGKDWAKTEESNWAYVISKLNDIADPEIDFEFNTIERDLEPSFLVNGKKTYLEELSSGFKSVLAIVFSIVEWIETTNDGKQANIQNASGTVLIDEIDAHLHPSWQIRIKGILEALFPYVQFIVTTHSPHVVSSAKEGEVGMLINNGEQLNVEFVDKDITAWKTDYIYTDIMNFEPEYDRNLANFVDAVEERIDEADLDGAMAVLDEYARHAHPEDLTPRALKRRIEKLQKRMVVDDQA